MKKFNRSSKSLFSPALIAPLALSTGLLGFAPSAQAVEVTVTIENLSPSSGLFLTPVWVGFHDGNFNIYDLNTPASPALERLAEDGNNAPLSAEFTANALGGLDATITDLGGVPGPLDPGGRVSQTFDLNSATNRFFSYATMVIPSNDAFIANANPQAYELFDAGGNFTGPISFTVLGTQVKDAGTEANTETDAAFFDQTAPNTGTPTTDPISMHPGFNGSLGNPGGVPVNILGGTSNDGVFFDSLAADFTRPGYAIARITITGPGDKLFNFVLDGNQEVPPADTPANGSCVGILNKDQTVFTANCHHTVQDATAAHIHEAPAGVNGDVIFPFASAESPIQETFNFTAENVATLMAGNFYINVHSGDFPGGEIRGQVAAPLKGSFSGSWFNPDRSGEGFLLEATNSDDPTLVATWFTYPPSSDSGAQAWLVGSGPIRLNESTITNTVITEGAVFGDGFDPSAVNRTPWGTLKFTFTSCTTGIVEYNSVIEGFGSGTFHIQRLTPPLIGQEGDCP
ncbi:spondin domain-containing protein [Nitrosococcus watsonii]|uniref:CHRD domain containing protein n=1 Tax=Nitrosococcus watsoni (strain C-113) TaxID=105559 RepID=D8K8R4_NITWC|nr:spondin domain-containing protein [Nitrosococcus watsonii]ADJ27124.1 CHRD domain containing protein [Nitrosococcus watsonii C-113]